MSIVKHQWYANWLNCPSHMKDVYNKQVFHWSRGAMLEIQERVNHIDISIEKIRAARWVLKKRSTKRYIESLSANQNIIFYSRILELDNKKKAIRKEVSSLYEERI